MRKRTSGKKQAKHARQTGRQQPDSAPARKPVDYVAPGRIEADVIRATNVANQIIIDKQTNNIYLAAQPVKTPLQRPPRAEYFIGREAEQDWLRENLQPGRVVTLCGPGGMGKSALAAEVLWKLFPGDTPPEPFPDGLIVHNFSRQPQVAVALEQIARIFGEDPRPTPAQAVQRALSGRKLLLMLDTAEEADDLNQILDACAGQAILVISRKRNDAADIGHLLDLHPLPNDHAVSVVQSWSQEQASDVMTVQQICRLVGNLPLALRLVGRYLALQQETVANYLQWLQQTPLAALDHGKSPHESIIVLLDRSLDKVSDDARKALMVVGLRIPDLSFIDRNLIAQALNISELRARRALNELQEYGLLLHRDQRYEVSHALIHTYVNEVLLARYERPNLYNLVTRLIRINFEKMSLYEKALESTFKDLISHVQDDPGMGEQNNLVMRRTATLLNQAGFYFYEKARYAEAEPFYKRSLSIYERLLGPEHPTTVVSLNNLADLYHSQGNYAEAIPLYQRALAICEQVPGPEHPDTALNLNNLATLYQKQGNYAAAAPLYQRSLAIFERVLGPEHPTTKTVSENYAACLKARDQQG